MLMFAVAFRRAYAQPECMRDLASTCQYSRTLLKSLHLCCGLRSQRASPIYFRDLMKRQARACDGVPGRKDGRDARGERVGARFL